MFFISSETGWTVGVPDAINTSIFKTTNGGINWVVQSHNVSSFVPSCVFFSTPEIGWITGYDGTILKTTNSGNNWSCTNTGSYCITGAFGDLRSVYFNSTSLGWVVGQYGMIIKTTSGGDPISVANSGISISNDFELFQNYPNPFNPKTTINYTLSESEYVTIKIYTVLGKEVATLVSAKQNPGLYSIQWDAGNFSSGIYFYKIITTSFEKTRRMVLLK
ncbi:MAG: T9SS type A sorting domain-containing protein [Ignavibacteria bacterium]|nr:T9SS type A sorting domain-containing protein [Ignavibacteria bacterium]